MKIITLYAENLKTFVMNRGEKTSEVLKSVRKQIAEANGITLCKKQKAGNVLKFIGVAAGVTAMIACQEAKAQENAEDDIAAVQQKFEWDCYEYIFTMRYPERITVQLDEMSEFISLFPNDTFLVVGHTDCRGSLQYNRKLSQSKADWARRQLVERGVNPGKIISVGAGNIEPRIPDPQTEAEHSQNRRYTLEFYSKERVEELLDRIQQELGE